MSETEKLSIFFKFIQENINRPDLLARLNIACDALFGGDL